ncbi:MAG: hypothetical protein WBI63_06130 [Coriobacteriia bacterium]
MLQDAGFDVMMDCDPRGPMHFYQFVFGSPWPAPIYVDPAQYADALLVLDAELVDDPWVNADPVERDTLPTQIGSHKRLAYAAWMIGPVAIVALVLFFGIQAQLESDRLGTALPA